MKLLFEYCTSSFSLFEDPIKNYIVMAAVGFIAYLITYKVVGWLYKQRLIYGSETGHVLHYIIRFITFVVLFLIFATGIRIINWLRNLSSYIWWIIGVVIGVYIIVISLKKVEQK